jgi:cytochrome c
MKNLLPLLFISFFFSNTSSDFIKNTPPQYKNDSTPNLEQNQDKGGEWVSLFNGKDLTGWRRFKEKTAGSSWIVDTTEHAICLNVEPRQKGSSKVKRDQGDLITMEEYENYELRLEWKISDCGNSGIIYNVLEHDSLMNTHESGAELQVLDNKCHPDAKIIKHRSGDLYDMISCKVENVKPAGEWNSIRLRIKNGKVEHWQNDVKQVEYDQNSPKWKEMIAASKFRKMPMFGTSRKGHIALQDHGNKVWYRDIKIRKL